MTPTDTCGVVERHEEVQETILRFLPLVRIHLLHLLAAYSLPHMLTHSPTYPLDISFDCMHIKNCQKRLSYQLGNRVRLSSATVSGAVLKKPTSSHIIIFEGNNFYIFGRRLLIH